MIRKLAFLLFILYSPSIFATPTACLEAYGSNQPLASWTNLPPVIDRDVSDRVIAAFRGQPEFDRLKTRYGRGENLVIRKQVLVASGGWMIQERLVFKILSTLFPDLKTVDPKTVEGSVPALRISDPTFMPVFDPAEFSISDLKILNEGPPLPSKLTLRAWLRLPPKAAIVSVYSSWRRDDRIAKFLVSLFRRETSDIILLSLQSTKGEPVGLRDALREAGIPLFESAEWITMDESVRPKRAIIKNETRERLPYIHAAADYAIVLGPANIFEPIQVGRPAFFELWATGHHEYAAWRYLVNAAVASGGGFPYDNEAELFKLLSKHPKAAAEDPALTDADVSRAAGNILKALDALLTAETSASTDSK